MYYLVACLKSQAERVYTAKNHDLSSTKLFLHLTDKQKIEIASAVSN